MCHYFFRLLHLYYKSINKTLTVEGTVVEDTIVNDKTKEKTNIVIAQDTTKTKDGRRTIPLSDDAYDALLELRNRFGSEGYVVKTEDGAMYRPSYVRKKMAAIVKKISKTDPTILRTCQHRKNME